MRAGWLLIVFLVALAAPLAAAEHRLEPLDSAAPDGLSKAVAAQLNSSGFKVIRGTSRTVCEVWLAKQWAVTSLEPKGDVNYVFTPGQLVGAIHFRNKGSDFRDQDIASGLYTLRYGQQPVDGAHVGTSPTRDFLLLVRASDDTSVDIMPYDKLSKASSTAAQSSHPALLSLRPRKVIGVKTPSIRENEEKEWWIVSVTGKAVAGEKSVPLTLDLVVAGQAAE